MWIMTPIGYFSAVDAGKGKLQIRARCDEDIERLATSMKARGCDPGGLVHTPHADYPVRIIVQREAFASWMHAEVLAINYGNFKNEVAKVDGHRAHSVYLEIWHILREALDPRQQRQQTIPIDDSYVRSARR